MRPIFLHCDSLVRDVWKCVKLDLHGLEVVFYLRSVLWVMSSSDVNDIW